MGSSTLYYIRFQQEPWLWLIIGTESLCSFVSQDKIQKLVQHFVETTY